MNEGFSAPATIVREIDVHIDGPKPPENKPSPGFVPGYKCTLFRGVHFHVCMGGKLAYLECEDTPGLIRFYEENGFYRFGNRNLDKDEPGQKRYLAQMIKYFSSHG